MKERQLSPDRTESFPSSFDTIIELLLIILLVFMPLAFGVVHAWSEEIVIALSGAITLCFLLKLAFHRDRGLFWSWAYISTGVFVLVAALGLIPLPASLTRILSPNTAAIKTELLGDLPNAGAVLGSMTLSFYPYATKHDLRLVLAIVAVFVVVLNVIRRPEQIKRLLTAIAIIGGIIATITLAQNLFGNGKIYWFISSQHTRGYSGPFVHHSNYGQFMNLSIGAALAVLMVKLHEDFTGRKVTPLAVFDYINSHSTRPLWGLAAIMSLGAATVFISLTRGGMVAMLIATAFTALLAAAKRPLKSHSWIMVVMALAAFTCVLYIGFDAVYDRLATLRDLHKAEAGRLQILKDIAIAWTKFPIFGTGLGTHSVVYPMFDRSTITALAAHADNEYAQALEETGLVGLGSLIIFGIIIWLNYARSIRKANPPIRAAAYGLGFGILAILIQSLTDFGQHLPSNAFLSAVFCALLLGLGQREENKPSVSPIARPSTNSGYLRAAVLIGISAIWLWTLLGANNARIGEIHWKKALTIEKPLIDKNWRGTETEYADLISHAQTASDYQPGNIKYRYWLNVYRWHSISQTTDPNTGDTLIAENSMPAVHDIVDQLHNACLLCPTYGPAYSIAGQIEKFILHDNGGAERIRKGFRLAPCDPVACFVAGYLDVLEGKTEDCVKKFERAVELDPELFAAIINIYINRLSRPDLAMSSAGDDISRLNYVANVLEDMQYNDLAEQVREKIKDLLEAKCSQSGALAPAFASLANIYKKQGNNDAAIEYYRRALALDYGQVEWRLDLAKLLAQMQRIPEAMREARVCLRVRPQLQAAEKLLADLSVRPGALEEESPAP
jgi:O-antigen ligase/tetratricopeptide (TPR) repeat protein